MAPEKWRSVTRSRERRGLGRRRGRRRGGRGLRMRAGLDARRAGEQGGTEQAMDELAAIQIGHEGRLLVRVPNVKLCAVTTDSLFAWHPLTPRVSLVGGNGANSVVIADGRDVLLVDTKETGFGARAARRGGARRRASGHVRRVDASSHGPRDGQSGVHRRRPGDRAAPRTRSARSTRAARALVEMAEGNGVDPYEAHVADLRDWAQYYDGHVRLDEGVRAEFESLAQQASDVMSGIVDRDARMAAVAPIAERFAPTETFESERALRVGRVEVELRHWGPGHTDGDVVVALPSEGIVIAADLVYVGLQPFIDAGAGGRTDEWIRRTDELRDLCGRMGRNGRPALVVPGHGEPASAEAVATQRAYFERLYEAVGDARRAGRSRADTVRLMPPGLPAERAAAPRRPTWGSCSTSWTRRPSGEEKSLVSPSDEKYCSGAFIEQKCCY